MWTSDHPLSRRHILAGAIGAASAGILAACGGTGASATPTRLAPTGTTAPSGAPTATAIAAVTPTAAPTATALPATPSATPAATAPPVVTVTGAPTASAASAIASGTALGTTTAGRFLESLLSIHVTDPNACAVDAQGNIYIGEYTNGNRVSKFDPTGKLITQWGERGDGDGQVYGITGLALDAKGNVYVADSMNVRIQIFDGNGKFLSRFDTEPPAGPASVAFDQQGNIYVTNIFMYQHYVQKFDPTGHLLLAWGTTGSGDGQFAATKSNGPDGIAVDVQRGVVYVVDAYNYRVQRFDTEGKFLGAFGSMGKGDGQFEDVPRSVALDGVGNLYVTCSPGDRLQQFDPTGRFLTKWTGADGKEWHNQVRRVVTLDRQGNIYLRDTGDNTIKKFRAP